MSDQLRTAVDFIRDVLRNEGITNEESINYTVTFFLCRFLDEKRCQRLNIPTRYIFSELLSLEEQKLYSALYTPGGESLFRYFVLSLKLSFLKDFKVKSPSNLYKIIHSLSRLDLESLEERYDLLGTVYEYHLKTGSSDPRDLGQYFTPRSVIEFIINLVQPREEETILDPTMGTGGFLTMAAKRGCRKIFGYDISEKVVSLANLNLFLEKGEKFSLERRNVLYEGLPRVEVILSNIPMGLKGIDYSSCCQAIQASGIRGTQGEPLFIQLYLNSLLPQGRAAIIVSLGFLFTRSKLHTETRKQLLQNSNLKKVITLGESRSFLNTGTKTAILYFEKHSSPTSSVTFSRLDEEENSFFSVTLEDITNNSYSLYAPDYLQEKNTGEFPFLTIEEACTFLPKSNRPASYGKERRDERNTVPFFTSSDKIKYCSRADYEEECIIVGNGGVANVKISSYFSCSNHNYIIKSKVPQLSNNYIYLYLRQNLHVLQSGFHGTGIENLSKSYLNKVKIPILPSPVLQEIEEAEERIKEAEEEIERRKRELEKIFENYLDRPLSSSSSPSSSRVGNLSKRIESLKEGKVLDVSSMTEEGKNVRPVNKPGSRSKKIGHEDLPLISNDKENYRLALEILKEEGKDYMYCMEIWE